MNSNFAADWDALCEHCGRPQRDHIWKDHPDPNYLHRMPCEPERRAIAARQRGIVRNARLLFLIGWVLIPLGIAILGFTNWWVGFAFLAFAILKVAWHLVEAYGSPADWFPGYAEKQKKELMMRHYFYHCERNPEGFARLREENFSKEYNDV
jgi:hypothetical protein